MSDRAADLLALHRAPEILVLPNVWDVASAHWVAAAGARALATASYAVAAAFGYPDGEHIPLDVHLDMVGRIAAAVDVPVTMDFEAGYGDPAATATRAAQAGAAGGNLEDRMAPLEDAVAAVEAVLRAVPGFVLNARTDAMLAGAGVDEAIRRGRAFLEAGAPVVFVPGAVRREDIAALVEALGRNRLSVLAVPGATPPVRELQELGVARVSTGPNTQRAALTALQDAARELLDGGTLPSYIRNTP
jgi:2-methylisocitrate lyase-like PEP mutase family enzyme